MNTQNILDFAVMQIPLLIGLTWKTAAEKAAIFRAIDAVKDSHDRRLGLLEKSLALLTQESQLSRASLEEKVSGQGKRFGSKFERIEKKVDVIDYKIILSKLDSISNKLEDKNQ